VRQLLIADLQRRVTTQAKVLQQDMLNHLLHDLAVLQKQILDQSASNDFNDQLAATVLQDKEQVLLQKVNRLENMLGVPLSLACVLPEHGLQRSDRRRGKSTGSVPVQKAEEPKGQKRRNSSAKKSEKAEPIV